MQADAADAAAGDWGERVDEAATKRESYSFSRLSDEA
jgi:hypothetical protein